MDKYVCNNNTIYTFLIYKYAKLKYKTGSFYIYIYMLQVCIPTDNIQN